MQNLLIVNLLISLLWPTLTGSFTLESLLLGFLLGFVVLGTLDRRYGRFVFLTGAFTLYVIYAILESNFRLAVLVLRLLFNGNAVVRSGIVGIPLRLTEPLDITVLASVITLTPGTLSVDLDTRDGKPDRLFVHSMNLSDPDDFRATIKDSFEQRILTLRSLASSMTETMPHQDDTVPDDTVPEGEES